ncbi:hypothetical protein ACFYVR_01050 [Rhodococcus sp. NPDC003318]|uniref:hypothetical protein n=1 Tax=Rhodococcus sp. NPDC003318 TaxID=3364503 RepID=UPI00369D4B72
MSDDPRDTARTARPAAGESVRDARNWFGYGAVLVGLVLVAACLAAAGYGFEGWAWITGVAGVLVLAAGVAGVVAEHRRVR